MLLLVVRGSRQVCRCGAVEDLDTGRVQMAAFWLGLLFLSKVDAGDPDAADVVSNGQYHSLLHFASLLRCMSPKDWTPADLILYVEPWWRHDWLAIW